MNTPKDTMPPAEDTVTVIDAPLMPARRATVRIWMDNGVEFTTDAADQENPATDMQTLGEAARDGEFIVDEYFLVRAKDIKCAAVVYED